MAQLVIRIDTDEIKASLRKRGPGLLLALIVELGIALLLLTIVPKFVREEVPVLTTFDASPDAPPAPEESPPDPAPKAEAKAPRPVPQPPAAAERVAPPPPPAAVPPVPAPAPAFIPMTSADLAAADIQGRGAPRAAAPVAGPPDSGSPGDSERVGTAPNGQPLYAAAWYREPTNAELAGYLSTANGPGWALIVCKTVEEYRVEECEGLSEYPTGSGMLRAVLAAAWQFRVRPPRRGGRSMVGSWVRIRIVAERRNR